MSQLAENLPIMVCPACGQTMKMLRSVPRAGGLPPLLTFLCPSCCEAQTQDDKRAA
jgi:predicted RNA-binding Zn-ribbon protein involved in translation (DUF1610 family)